MLEIMLALMVIIKLFRIVYTNLFVVARLISRVDVR